MSSILGRRLAGKEAAYFLEESKSAVSRLADKIPKTKTSARADCDNSVSDSSSSSADILPEVLRHSLPSKFYRQENQAVLSLSDSHSSAKAKWTIQSNINTNNNHNRVSSDALNPLRAYVSLPQLTFGPKRWQLPSAQSSTTASTANELRRDQYTQLNPEKLRAAAEGLARIGKAFAAATAIIFGGAAVAYGLTVSKLDLHNGDDIQSKLRDLGQPKFDTIKEQMTPLRDWAENTSKKWRLKNEHEIKDRPVIKELSKILGAKSST